MVDDQPHRPGPELVVVLLRHDAPYLPSKEGVHQTRGGSGTGLRWLRVDHTGNRTRSVEEAEVIAAELTRLMGSAWTNHDSATQPLRPNDFMIVVPYNDQVKTIRTRLNQDPELEAVEVGTVDKFQGREAAVVFFSMATSTGGDMVRGTDFLFSRNRLNVAVSRARCLAYLVCTDALLDTRAGTVEDMRLIGTLNAFVEACGGASDSGGA
ncbi:AAA domain-containing protein [Mycolicibacterium fallax]|uniref:AAA domain-containing protein n=1 Tax=Mycolicibacterium fallax TaxID=1793 RepID=UPI0013D47CF3|nr:C-terminal helicase domain-containing protein [Mycolicibacterium fallax]